MEVSQVILALGIGVALAWYAFLTRDSWLTKLESALGTRFTAPPESGPTKKQPLDPKTFILHSRAVYASGILHNLRATAKSLGKYTGIPPVKVTIPFPGWDYVEGARSALRVNRKVHLVAGDDVMVGYSDVCILLNQVPVAMLRCSSVLSITQLTVERGYFQEVITGAPGKQNLLVEEGYGNLPESTRILVSDVMRCLAEHPVVQLKITGVHPGEEHLQSYS
jgi:hypothetical protein